MKIVNTVFLGFLVEKNELIEEYTRKVCPNNHYVKDQNSTFCPDCASELIIVRGVNAKNPLVSLASAYGKQNESENFFNSLVSSNELRFASICAQQMGPQDLNILTAIGLDICKWTVGEDDNPLALVNYNAETLSSLITELWKVRTVMSLYDREVQLFLVTTITKEVAVESTYSSPAPIEHNEVVQPVLMLEDGV